MTKKQFLTKIDELSDTTARDIRKNARKLLQTNALNLNDWENDYQFPKIVLTALCREAAWQWQPLVKASRQEVSNIERLI